MKAKILIIAFLISFSIVLAPKGALAVVCGWYCSSPNVCMPDTEPAPSDCSGCNNTTGNPQFCAKASCLAKCY